MHIRPATAAPASPPPCNITAARQTKEDFHGLLMGTMTQDGPDKSVTAKANTHTYRTNHRKTEQEGPSSHPVTVALETVPKPDRKTGKERKNNQKDNKNTQKQGTENLIRGKSVAPNLNIYAKAHPKPAYIPYIIHSVSAKRKINRKRTVLHSAHKMETTGQIRKTARLKTGKDKHPGHGNTPSEPHPGFIRKKNGTHLE